MIGSEPSRSRVERPEGRAISLILEYAFDDIERVCGSFILGHRRAVCAQLDHVHGVESGVDGCGRSLAKRGVRLALRDVGGESINVSVEHGGGIGCLAGECLSGGQRRRGRSSEQPPQEKRVTTIPTGSRPDPLPRSRSGGHVTQMHLAGSTRLVLPAVDRPIASSASRSGSAHQRGVAVDDHQSTGASVDRLSTGVGSPSVSNAESISESASGSMWAAGQVRPRVSSR